MSNLCRSLSTWDAMLGVIVRQELASNQKGLPPQVLGCIISIEAAAWAGHIGQPSVQKHAPMVCVG